jgi:phage FluMu gp28-like protein
MTIGLCKKHGVYQAATLSCLICESEKVVQIETGDHIYVFGQDLASKHDFVALTVLDVRDCKARVVKLVMWPHTQFEVIMRDTKALYNEIGGQVFEIDQTGLGIPIVEWYLSIGLQAVGKTFTPQSKWDMRNYTRKLMQDRMLALPKTGPNVAELKAQLKEQELIQGAGKVPKLDHPSGRHDDLAWSLMLAADAARPWLTEQRYAVMTKPTIRRPPGFFAG